MASCRLEGIFHTMEDSSCSIFLLIYQIKGLKHPESNPKDSGNETRRLLDKPLAYSPDPLDGRVFFFVPIGDAGQLMALFPGLGVMLNNFGRQEERHMKQKKGEG